MTIITKLQNNTAIILLNRHDRYNAMDLRTIQEISSFLSVCVANDKIQKIIITSDHPKAFCAGGDIRMAYEAMLNNDRSLASTFFKEEYNLIYKLATCSKPVISIVNGLCFGGGMGLSMHNQIRIITENAILGMPETIIGFFPDVAASFRFAQFPKAWGNFYGFTGANISINHALKWNMADHFIPSHALSDFINDLTNTDNTQQVINQFSQPVPVSSSFGDQWVNEVFSQELKNIFIELKNHQHPETKKILNDLLTRSPLSLLITDRLLKLSPCLDLKQALELDYHISFNFLINSDFQEGIRAQIIDKDRSPQWTYTLENVNDNMIEQFFKPAQDLVII
ncbi:MAG: enoyl-CoA hydratase/isomerase family protein [Pseudomonadota bacterium]|nr:enoyl-CoA hydratase/isomerase family protein [Alphaproteobacteria bacterium]